MNPLLSQPGSLLTQLTPLLLSVAVPHLAAVLNDPRPERRWLRVVIALVLVLAGAAIELIQSGQWSTETYLRAVGVLFVGSQGVFRLLRDTYLGKLEQSTGNGVGALLDLGKGAIGGGGGSIRQRLQELSELLQADAITQAEYDARRAAILEDV